MGAAPQFVLDSLDDPPSPQGESEDADSAALDAYSKTVIPVAKRVGLTVVHVEVEHLDF
jgi:hypothetical protein